MAWLILGCVRQFISSSGNTSWKMQQSLLRYQTSVASCIYFILNIRVHNVQTSSYKSLHKRKIFPLQPRKLFWDKERTHMSRRSIQGGHTLSPILARSVNFKSVHTMTLNLGTKMWVPDTLAHCLEAPKRGQLFLTLSLSRFLLTGRTTVFPGTTSNFLFMPK